MRSPQGAAKAAELESERLRHAAAKLKVRAAMALVEGAQRELNRACAMLAPIQYGHPAQKRVRRLYDRVHAEWYKLQRLFDDPRIRLDRELTDEELAFHAKAGGQ